jgi:hypothetical protein
LQEPQYFNATLTTATTRDKAGRQFSPT